MRRSKFNNVRTLVDGHMLDSKSEAKRYGELKLMERGKLIKDLNVHPKYPIEVNGQRVCFYEADFSYKDKEGKLRIEDVKGVRTALFILKKKLLKAVHGLDVVEIKKASRGSFPGVDIDKVHSKWRS